MVETQQVSEMTWPGPGEYAGRSPYHLTPQQVQFFDTHGYLILRQWIPEPLLSRLQAAGTAWIEQGWALDEENSGRADFHFAERNGGKVMFRVDYLHDKGQAASLELLGSPYVLGVAESLCGPNAVPTYESMVFKQEGDGQAIPWHQDACHPRHYRIFNFDLYLDRSRVGAGALRVIPGSQRQKHDVCAVAEEYGWDVPGVISVEMEPGDVLLHDVMVLHGSEQVAGNALRRTIYYEFRAAEEILEEGPWDRTWIDRRLRLLPVALEQFRATFPDVPPFDWQVSPEFRPQPSGTPEQELRIAHLVHMAGSFCSAGSSGPGKGVRAPSPSSPSA